MNASRAPPPGDSPCCSAALLPWSKNRCEGLSAGSPSKWSAQRRPRRFRVMKTRDQPRPKAERDWPSAWVKPASRPGAQVAGVGIAGRRRTCSPADPTEKKSIARLSAQAQRVCAKNGAPPDPGGGREGEGRGSQGRGVAQAPQLRHTHIGSCLLTCTPAVAVGFS
jgi:hypothetical protein